MAPVINGRITAHIGRAGKRGFGHPPGSSGIIHGHALSSRAGALVPIIRLDDIRTHGHALVLGTGRSGLGLDNRND